MLVLKRKTDRYEPRVVEGLLALLRVALGKASVTELRPGLFAALDLADWRQLRDLAVEHAVPAIALDGLGAILESGMDAGIAVESDPWQDFVLDWTTFQLQIELQYADYERKLTRLARFYERQGIRMMVLKGYGLSLHYPRPNHRPTGDLDIYLFGRQQEADALIAQAGVPVDKSHHHHTTFFFEGLYVENHYDFLNQYSHLSSRVIERELHGLCDDCRPDEKIPNVFYPSPEFNTLFLLRHMGAHFAAERMTLRQLLDWALSPQTPLANEYKMHDFRLVANAVCNRYLGFDLPADGADEAMVERVFDDMIHPCQYERLTLLARLCRWFENRWKSRLFYQEGLFKTFWVQLWSHLVRPKGSSFLSKE